LSISAIPRFTRAVPVWADETEAVIPTTVDPAEQANPSRFGLDSDDHVDL
jgi:hypothetical protein